MKKIIFILISLFIVVSSGCFFMHYYEKQQVKEQYFAKQEQRVEVYLKYNIPEFKTITFTDEGRTPMGIPYLDGYINNDKKLKFSASVHPNDYNFEGSMGMSNELDKLFKTDKPYSEIINEEQNKKE